MALGCVKHELWSITTTSNITHIVRQWSEQVQAHAYSENSSLVDLVEKPRIELSKKKKVGKEIHGGGFAEIVCAYLCTPSILHPYSIAVGIEY